MCCIRILALSHGQLLWSVVYKLLLYFHLVNFFEMLPVSCYCAFSRSSSLECCPRVAVVLSVGQWTTLKCCPQVTAMLSLGQLLYSVVHELLLSFQSASYSGVSSTSFCAFTQSTALECIYEFLCFYLDNCSRVLFRCYCTFTRSASQQYCPWVIVFSLGQLLCSVVKNLLLCFHSVICSGLLPTSCCWLSLYRLVWSVAHELLLYFQSRNCSGVLLTSCCCAFSRAPALDYCPQVITMLSLYRLFWSVVHELLLCFQSVIYFECCPRVAANFQSVICFGVLPIGGFW